jgi:NDP-sugar pyrophosphorylase family protein
MRGEPARNARSRVEPELRLAEVPALILAGGAGTRLRPVVSDRPKPMASVGGRPFLELQIESLRRAGVARFVLCVGYMRRHIEEHFADGGRFGVAIEYSVEDEPLGTGGALRLAAGRVAGPFLALNGDSYLDADLADLARAHAQSRAADPRCLGTLALAAVSDPRAFGCVRTDPSGRILRFEEKPGSEGPAHVNAGVYLLERALLDRIPEGRPVSLERETFPALLADGFHLYGREADGFFVDIGTPDGYRRFGEYVQQRRQKLT